MAISNTWTCEKGGHRPYLLDANGPKQEPEFDLVRIYLRLDPELLTAFLAFEQVGASPNEVCRHNDRKTPA